MLIFGAVQIVMSQIPDFHNMEWLSVVAAIMAFTYSFIGLGLGFAKVVGMVAQFPLMNLEIRNCMLVLGCFWIEELGNE